MLTLCGAFVTIAGMTLRDPERSSAMSLGVAAGSAGIACLLVWASSLAVVDALRGEAIRESGATPLASRWSGRSLRTPSGRFVEFVLWNPWTSLDGDASYTVTYGARSGVIVEAPQLEGTRGATSAGGR